jgi:hypothetical protein
MGWVDPPLAPTLIKAPARERSLQGHESDRTSRTPHSLLHPPRRTFLPGFQSLRDPGKSYVGMAHAARIRNFERLSVGWSDESESMRMHVDVSQCLLDSRHVARSALAVRPIRLVVRVRLNSWRERSGLGVRSTAGQAQAISVRANHRGVVVSMRIVA